jgi:hypothetical protein
VRSNIRPVPLHVFLANGGSRIPDHPTCPFPEFPNGGDRSNGQMVTNIRPVPLRDISPTCPSSRYLSIGWLHSTCPFVRSPGLLVPLYGLLGVLRKSDSTFFSATHCGMGVPPVIFVRARAGRPCHNASPTAHANSTESRDLNLAPFQVSRRDRDPRALFSGTRSASVYSALEERRWRYPDLWGSSFGHDSRSGILRGSSPRLIRLYFTDVMF